MRAAIIAASAVVVFVIGALSGILFMHLDAAGKVDRQAQEIYEHACVAQGNVVLDGVCYNPVMLNEAKVFIQTG